MTAVPQSVIWGVFILSGRKPDDLAIAKGQRPSQILGHSVEFPFGAKELITLISHAPIACLQSLGQVFVVLVPIG